MTLRRLWHVAGWAFVAAVVYLSLNANPIDVGRIEDVKVGHFIAYGWLMLWFAQLFPAVRTRAGIAVALALMGVALEYLQAMTGYRSFAYSDMRDNVLGVLAGWAIARTSLGRGLDMIEVFLARRDTNSADRNIPKFQPEVPKK